MQLRHEKKPEVGATGQTMLANLLRTKKHETDAAYAALMTSTDEELITE